MPKRQVIGLNRGTGPTLGLFVLFLGESPGCRIFDIASMLDG